LKILQKVLLHTSYRNCPWEKLKIRVLRRFPRLGKMENKKELSNTALGVALLVPKLEDVKILWSKCKRGEKC